MSEKNNCWNRYVVELFDDGTIGLNGFAEFNGIESETAFLLAPQDGQQVEGADHAALLAFLQSHPSQGLIGIQDGIITAEEPEPEERSIGR